jgi:two-component system, LuxR family, response regulator FixJ
MNDDWTVFIVDDDPKVCQSLGSLVRSLGLEYETFDSTIEFLDVFDPMRSGCLLLDVRLSGHHVNAESHAGHNTHTSGRRAQAFAGMSGLELLECINSKVFCMPAIVISAHTDVPAVVRMVRAGAIDVLKKPCRESSLWQAVQKCVEWDAAHRPRLVQATKISRRLDHLKTREYCVLEKLLEGKSNKIIADELSVSVRTIEVRRAKLMRTMKADTLTDLIRMLTIMELVGGEIKTLDSRRGRGELIAQKSER